MLTEKKQKLCHMLETSTSQTLISVKAQLDVQHIDLETKVEQIKEKVWNRLETKKYCQSKMIRF